jgi:hypothetical protein
VFTDAEHVVGTVTIRSIRAHDRDPRCLVFASDRAIRQVYDVPADRRDSGPAALAALSCRR